jgi:uncharacterized RDD family membrane protein YckC
MAHCSNCGSEMSDAATACPQCGHPTAVGASTNQYAGFGIRFVALLIDVVILSILGAVLGPSGRPIGAILGFAYNWLMLGLNDGRTLGKMALGIRIARPDGTSLDLGTAAARAGMALVSGLALGIGYLWAAWDPENRTWHDMVANTRAFRVGR